MKIIKLNSQFTFKEKVTLCLGYFDGLHKGHLELIQAAKETGNKVAILTFDISPKHFFNHEENKTLLSDAKRNTILNSAEVDCLLIQNFNDTLASLEPIEFINQVLMPLNPETLVVGYDYHFGKNALGNIELLKQYFDVIEISQIGDSKGKYSASRVINSLNISDINDVTHTLGRYYSLEGMVVKGLQNGRKIGFNTANMDMMTNYYLPGKGVYACFAYVNNDRYMAMVNIGVHPTINKLNSPLIEVHILDFNQNIYHQNICIEFVSFIREESIFDSLDKLKIQLEKDELVVREILVNSK